MSKWTESGGSSKAPGQVSFGTDTDQSVSVDPWMLDSTGVVHLAAPGAAAYDTVMQRTAAGTVAINGMPIGAGSTVAGAGSTVTGVTAETLLASGYTVASGGLAAGQVYHMVAHGTITTTVDTQTLDLRLRYGGLAGTVILDFGSQNPNASATITNGRWRFEADVMLTDATHMSVSGQDALNFFPTAVTGAETAVPTTGGQFVLTVQPSASALSMTCTAFYCERVA